MYKVGILGNCCTHGVGAVNALKSRAEIEIVAGYEPSRRRGKELADALGLALTGSYDAIFENPNIDIVAITTWS